MNQWNEIPELLFVLGVGWLLGLIFFGGLWLTTRHIMSVKMPGLLAIVSMFLRVGIVLVGVYFVTEGRLLPVISCMAGFILARMTWIKKIRAGSNNTVLTKEEES